ncbi:MULTISPECIES: thiamine phosphate synthase [unclassified Salinivibrio]|uniref:thiamine phosphate synthase n=1 Tax=unclassified Salinivibrio TaxID=2636825 RepID=UPI0009845EC2|nr:MULTISPECIES: thiamine phosphate synthase [unclassified Salinivibrio]OOF14863.1 thiamine-phosphate diphosphorylase [Salinivibrio sp. PR919]OOF18832.1 thiamine-phosphate diphosphorylase [Salinivibrio sp. PR932]
MSLTPFASMSEGIGPLYPVVDDVDLLERLLCLGVKTVQLRVKQPGHPQLADWVQRAVALGRAHHAQVFINDHWQLALEAGAYGVHLGQQDIQEADLDLLARQGVRLGVSTRSPEQLAAAIALSPSYLAIGHIFPTTTKQLAEPPQGISALAQQVATVDGRFPTVAIGGIDLNRAPDVWRTGVDAIAVVRAVTQAPDLAALIDAFNRCLNPSRQQGGRDAIGQ